MPDSVLNSRLHSLVRAVVLFGGLLACSSTSGPAPVPTAPPPEAAAPEPQEFSGEFWELDGDGATTPGAKDISPPRQCRWTYSELGLDAFYSAATTPGWNPEFNPFITISRRGLTLRLVGTLSDSFMSRYGGDLARVQAAFPHLVPVRQTAVHTIVEEIPNRSTRGDPTAGAVSETTVVDWPPNTVMLVYPIAIARRSAGYNSPAGNRQLYYQAREAPNNDKGPFAGFPFLKFSNTSGHAIHGPITRNPSAWRVIRGEESHGCIRMQGEHVVELAVLVGCAKDPRRGGCPSPSVGGADRVPVTVMEDFDHVPSPDARVRPGSVGSWDEIYEQWRIVDVDYPRTYPVPDRLIETVDGKTAYEFEKVLAPRSPRRGDPRNVPVAIPERFPTWDDRVLDLVTAGGC